MRGFIVAKLVGCLRQAAQEVLAVLTKIAGDVFVLKPDLDDYVAIENGG